MVLKKPTTYFIKWPNSNTIRILVYVTYIYVCSRHCQTWTNWRDYLQRSSLIFGDRFPTIGITVRHPNLTKPDTKKRSLNVFKFSPPYFYLLLLPHLHLYLLLFQMENNPVVSHHLPTFCFCKVQMSKNTGQNSFKSQLFWVASHLPGLPQWK